MSFRFPSFSSLLSTSRVLSILCFSLEFLFHPIPFPFRLGPKISGRDLLLVEECCNAPDSMRQVSTSYSPSLPCHVLVCCILPCHHLHFISCHHVHFILHTCSSLASEHFPRCPFCNPALRCRPASPSYLFSCAGIKLSRNGPSFAKWPWYSTGKPHVKFRAIWRLFDTPTVNRITAKASFELQPNTPPRQPNNPSKSLPCSSSSDHNRVGENYTSLGHS